MNSYWGRIKTYWQKLPIERRGSIAIAIPLTCLLGSVIADTLLRQRIVEAQIYINHTTQVIATSETTLINLLNAETGLRGYFIGKQPIFLEPYSRALTTIEPSLINLAQLVRSNPVQVQRAQLLTQLARDKIVHLQEIVEQVQTKKMVSTEDTTKSLLKGKQTMDKFREIIQEFEAEERRLLLIHTSQLQAQQDFNGYVMWWGVAIGLLATTISMRILTELATELRSRELNLRESRNLIQAIVVNVLDGVIVINPQGKIETFNDAALNMFGYLPTEIVGMDWQKLLDRTEENTQKMFFHAPDLLENTQPKVAIWQAMGERKNGDRFPIEISIDRIALVEDLPTATQWARIAIVRDITEREQVAAKLQDTALQLTILNTSLNTTNQSLVHSNLELDRFAYITAHDLKAPLRAIASLSEWIEEDLDAQMSPENRSQMHLLRSRVYRMQALLDSLLEYSRSGRRQAPITTVEVDLLLSEIILALAPPDTFGVKISSPMPIIQTRSQPLRQVLTHLIDNAIRHNPNTMGIVEISAIDRGDRYEFIIADNGEGIDPQFQDRIYTIFQTLKARDLQENVGAGLAIVKKVLTAEGGTIHLESALGSGSTFRFTWLKEAIVRE